MSSIPSLVSLFLVFATAAYSTLDTRAGDSIIDNCNHDFAYTFDNGPYLWEDEIVDEFDCAASKTTFFVNGNQLSCIYSEDNVQRLRYAFEAGHQIASQGWSSTDFLTLSEAQIDVEIQRLDEALIKILGVKPMVFRAPGNSLSDSAAAYITTKYGKTVVSADADSGDANAGETAQDSYQFYQGLANQGSGHPHLTLSHETEPNAVDAVDMGTVGLLTSAGIKLVTVAECLDIAPYEVVGNYGVRDASWSCDGSWSPPAPTCSQTYRATAADNTCSAIAAKFGLTPQAVYFANPFLDCENVWNGTPLCLPAATTPPQVACAQKYTTAAGETCNSIAAKFGITAESLFSANTFVTCTDIWVGTVLCVPASDTASCSAKYSSVAGDTCDSIASLYHLSSDAIKSYNSFLNCNNIWLNTPICIPPGGENCITQYIAGDNETCSTVANKFGLSATAVYNANPFVSCDNIWKYTSLCIPPGGSGCTNTISSWSGATCDSIASAYGTTPENIQLWNSFVDCNSIWTNTPICVSH